MKTFLIRIILLVICSLIIGYSLSRIVDSIPLVYWSVSKDECVKVMVFDRNKKEWVEQNCDYIPEKYEKIYVE